MSINYRPILTDVGAQVIADAIANGTDIVLDSIALGDASGFEEYNVSPDMTSLKNEVTRIKVRTVTMDIHMFYGEAVARIFGYVNPNSAVDMVIKEAGVYDIEGNLLFITRTADIGTATAGALRTGVKIKINKKIPEAAAKYFVVQATDNTDGILTTELNEHIEQTLNIHRTDKEQIGLGEVENIPDNELPVSDLMLDMISDTKMATGFISRTTNRLFNANNMLTLIIDSPTGIYKNGVLYTLTENATINLGYQPEWEEVDGEGNPTGVIHPAIPASSGEFFICLDVDSNTLYKEDNPNIETDILVAYAVCNVSQGIISINDERHAASKNLNWYNTQELMNKISWLNGGELLLAEDSDTNVNMSITSPVMMANKDIHYRIEHSDNPVVDYAQDLTNMFPPVMYLNSGNEIVVESSTNIPWLHNGSKIVYNNRSNGSLSAVSNNRYINYLIVYTADVVAPIKMIVGSTVYTTELAASSDDISVFDYILERIRCKVAYRIVLHSDTGHTGNAYNISVAKIENLANNTSLRNSMAPKNHNELGDSRFEDDQHGIENIEGLAEAIAGVGLIRSASVNGNITGDGVLIDDTVVIDNGQADTSLWDEDDEEDSYLAVTTSIGTAYAGTNKWAGQVLAPNGMIYSVPLNATQVLEINPTTKTTALVGAVHSSEWKWSNGVLAPNGKIYFIPYNATQVLEFDPVTKASVSIGTSYAGMDKWTHGVLAPNGNIYCVPYNTTQILEINPTTKTTALVGPVLNGTLKWYDGILAPNGNIYFVPQSAARVLEFNPVTKVGTSIGSTYNETEKWRTGVLAPNGKIYCAPLNATQILEIDPETKTTQLVGGVYNGGAKWFGAVLAPNGRMYCTPHSAIQILEFDPFSKKTKLVGNQYTSGAKWQHAVIANNGLLYFTPRNATQVLEVEISLESKTTVFTDLIGTAYSGVNKWVYPTLALNGKIYAIPHDATQVLEIDPNTKTAALIGTVYNGGGKWSNGILTKDNKIYCPPILASKVLSIDPISKTTMLIGTDYGITAEKWGTGCLAKNGNIYCAPRESAQVLEINTTLNTTTLIGTSFGTTKGKWVAGTVLAPNGKIYCAPWDATQVLEIDPATKTTVLIGSVYSGIAKWRGAALAPNGKIYCVPSSATQVLEIDPVTKTTVLIGSVYNGSAKWYGAVLAPNGLIYCIPSNATNILEINPETKETRLVNSYNIGLGWNTGCLAPNGKIYCAPWNATQVLEIDPFPKSTDFGSYLISGQLKI